MTCSPGISPNGSPLQKSPLPDSSTPQPALGFLTISLHTIDHQPRGAITFAHNGCRKLRATLTILPVSRCPPSIWVDTHTPPPTCNKRGAENRALTVRLPPRFSSRRSPQRPCRASHRAFQRIEGRVDRGFPPAPVNQAPAPFFPRLVIIPKQQQCGGQCRDPAQRRNHEACA